MLEKIYAWIKANPEKALKIAAAAVAAASAAGYAVPEWAPGALASLIRILAGN